MKTLRLEREMAKLSNITNTFYEDAAKYFQMLQQNPFDLDVRKYNNAYSSYTEIVERRLNKIMERAYVLSIRQHKLNQMPQIPEAEDIFPENIHQSEKKLFLNFIENFKEFYKNRYDEYSLIKMKEDDVK